jgi:hypothetical protein
VNPILGNPAGDRIAVACRLRPSGNRNRYAHFVGGVGGEIAIDQIGRRSRVTIANGCPETFTTAGSVNMAFPHKARQALSACADPRVAHIVSQSRSTVRRTRTFEVHL